MAHQPSRRFKKNAIPAGLLVAAIGIAVAVWGGKQPHAPLEPDVVRRAGIIAWYPDPANDGPVIDEKSLKITQEDSDRVLTFVAKRGSQTVTFSEQAVPESMVDVPAVYDKLIESWNNYASVEGEMGKVALTRASKSAKQTAVFKAKGTLVFMRAESDMTNDDWRQWILSLESLKP